MGSCLKIVCCFTCQGFFNSLQLVCFFGGIADIASTECNPAIVKEELASNEGLRLTFRDKGELDETLSTVGAESSSDFDPWEVWGDLYQALEDLFGDLFNQQYLKGHN